MGVGYVGVGWVGYDITNIRQIYHHTETRSIIFLQEDLTDT